MASSEANVTENQPQQNANTPKSSAAIKKKEFNLRGLLSTKDKSQRAQIVLASPINRQSADHIFSSPKSQESLRSRGTSSL